jgi:hypothetical protein
MPIAASFDVSDTQSPRFQPVIPSSLEKTKIVEGSDTVKKEDHHIAEVSLDKMSDVVLKISQYGKSTDIMIIPLVLARPEMPHEIPPVKEPNTEKEVTCPRCNGKGKIFL